MLRLNGRIRVAWQLKLLRRIMNLHYFVLRSGDLVRERNPYDMLLCGLSRKTKEQLPGSTVLVSFLGSRMAWLFLRKRAYSHFYITSIYAAALFDRVFYKPKF